MKIAIIGTGISGLVAAHLLSKDFDLRIYESSQNIGGHTHTIPIELQGKIHPVDTGFIVFNDWTYPNFIRLMEKIGVASQPTSMSFAVKCEKTGFEYSSNSFNSLFCQKKNWLDPFHYLFLTEILRFYSTAPEVLEDKRFQRMLLGDYLKLRGFSERFIDYYILPLGASIWSSSQVQLLNFPVVFFVEFFKNHGMLSVFRQPQWRIIEGGSCRYVEKLTVPFRDKIMVDTPVRQVTRHRDHVRVKTSSGEVEKFDHVIFATHSDQALKILSDPSPAEREILGAIPYQKNEAVLHHDDRFYVKDPKAWASWNFLIPKSRRNQVLLTYNMSRLQSLEAPVNFSVSLNQTAQIDPKKIYRKITYHHPLYGLNTMDAQRRWQEINGVRRTYYCGAYWGYGFHEDGVNSALRVGKLFGKEL